TIQAAGISGGFNQNVSLPEQASSKSLQRCIILKSRRTKRLTVVVISQIHRSGSAANLLIVYRPAYTLVDLVFRCTFVVRWIAYTRNRDIAWKLATEAGS